MPSWFGACSELGSSEGGSDHSLLSPLSRHGILPPCGFEDSILVFEEFDREIVIILEFICVTFDFFSSYKF